MSKLATTTSLNRENLYRMLSSKGNPEFFSLCTVLSAVGFRLAVDPKRAATKKVILHSYVTQVKEAMSQYALAADTDSTEKTEILLRTPDDKEIGRLEFDDTDGALLMRVTSDLPLKEVKQAEIRTNDGQVLTSQVSMEEKHCLVLLRKKKVSPENVAQITLTIGV